MNYRVIKSNYEVQFCGAIEKAIAEGWQLQGGVAVVQMPGSGVVTLYQALVKPLEAAVTRLVEASDVVSFTAPPVTLADSEALPRPRQKRVAHAH